MFIYRSLQSQLTINVTQSLILSAFLNFDLVCTQQIINITGM